MAEKQIQHSEDKSPYYWAIARMTLGVMFFWAFLDKLFGLGFATCKNVESGTVILLCEQSWLGGGSPTAGFLEFATRGPLAGLYQSLAGNAFIDTLFMTGLCLIGLALIAGVGIRIAVYSGVLLMAMMWSSMLPPENNPIIDEHIIYIIVLMGILSANSKQKWGLREVWKNQSIVQRFPILE